MAKELSIAYAAAAIFVGLFVIVVLPLIVVVSLYELVTAGKNRR